MTLAFYILALFFIAIAYFLLSFLFNIIGSLAMKMWNKFNKNIGEEMNKENNDD